MTEDEDDEEEIDTYKMGVSMMISDKDRIETRKTGIVTEQ